MKHEQNAISLSHKRTQRDTKRESLFCELSCPFVTIPPQPFTNSSVPSVSSCSNSRSYPNFPGSFFEIPTTLSRAPFQRLSINFQKGIRCGGSHLYVRIVEQISQSRYGRRGFATKFCHGFCCAPPDVWSGSPKAICQCQQDNI